MAVKRQTQVVAANEVLAGRAVGQFADDYRRDVVGPLIRRIRKAKSLNGLLAQLGPGAVREMDSSALEKAHSDLAVQGRLNGRLSAKPREATKRRGSDEATKPRSDVVSTF